MAELAASEARAIHIAGHDYTAVTAGTIDGKTGLKLTEHIYCDNAGGYYQIADNAAKLAQSS